MTPDNRRIYDPNELVGKTIERATFADSTYCDSERLVLVMTDGSYLVVDTMSLEESSLIFYGATTEAERTAWGIDDPTGVSPPGA
jgi:protein-tyrosine-phosphatase